MGITWKTKLAVYRTVLLSSLLYDCESWTCYCCLSMNPPTSYSSFCLCRLPGIPGVGDFTNQEVFCHAASLVSGHLSCSPC